jgi:hypothetical protein
VPPPASSVGTNTSTTLWAASIRARNAASRLSLLRLLSAAGLSTLETAATTHSTPNSLSSRARCQPAGPDS